MKFSATFDQLASMCFVEAPYTVTTHAQKYRKKSGTFF